MKVDLNDYLDKKCEDCDWFREEEPKETACHDAGKSGDTTKDDDACDFFVPII